MMTVKYHPKSKEDSLNKKNFEKNIEKIIIDNNNIIDNNINTQQNNEKLDDSSLRSSQVTIKISDNKSVLNKDDFFEFVQFRNFSEGKKSFISSPRASHVQISRNDFYHLPQYEEMEKWFNNNVSGYLRKKESWSRHVYPERLLYVYGPRGMGRLTLTLLLCNDAQVNLIFVPSSIHETTIYLKLIKKAKEMQPCLIFFDDFDPVLGFDPCLNALYASMNAHLNKRDDDIWIVMTGITPPENLSAPSKCMIADYGSITDVNAIENEQQAQDLIMKMLNTISRVPDYPCSFEELSDPYSQWSNMLKLLSRYGRYCTIKELEIFFIKLFRNYHQQAKDDDASYLPTLEAFNQMMDDIPFVDDRSDVRSIAISRKAAEEYQKHENEWKLYIMVSGIKTTPRSTFSPASPGNTLLPRPMSTPVPPSSYQTPVIPSSISREEQRNLEREKRRQQRVNAETENMLQSGYDFSGLTVPQQQSQPKRIDPHTPLHFNDRDHEHGGEDSRPFISPPTSNASSFISNNTRSGTDRSVGRETFFSQQTEELRNGTQTQSPGSSYHSLSSPSRSVFDEDSTDGNKTNQPSQNLSKKPSSSTRSQSSSISSPSSPPPSSVIISNHEKPSLPKLLPSQFKKRQTRSSTASSASVFSSKKNSPSPTSSSSSSSAAENFLKRLRVN